MPDKVSPDTTVIKQAAPKLTARESAVVRPQTANDKDRTVRAICTTSKPAEVMHWDKGIILETLIMDGCILPERGKVPLLNAHNRHDVNDVLGSTYDFAFGAEMFGEAEYDFLEATVQVDESEDKAWGKLKNGHCDRFSVGYYVYEYIVVKAGTTTKYKGMTYEAPKESPLYLATKWELIENSLVPIPADDLATARTKTPETVTEAAPTAAPEFTNPERKETMPTEKTETPIVNVSDVVKQALEAERARVADITEACRAAGLEPAEMIASGKTADEARKEIIKSMAAKSTPVGRVELVADAKDKLTRAAIAGIATGLGAKAENVPGSETFQHSILRTAEEVLSLSGVNTRAMRKDEIVNRALTSGDFTHIFGSAANQALGQLYAKVTDNFSGWVNEIDAPDYRTIDAVNLSMGGDLDEMTTDGTEVPLAQPVDEGEQYRVTPKAKRLVLGRQILLGDNLGAFIRMLDAWTIKAKNGLNKAVFSILNTNPNMADGVALFHADHDNLPTGAVLSSSALASAWGAFRKIEDPDGNPMNTPPAFLIVSSDYEYTANQLVTSATVPGSTNGDANMFKGKLQVVSDANLTSATWYLAGAKGISDTIQIAYLLGKRVPELLEQPKISVLGVEYVIVFDYGVKAVSHRSLLKGK